MCAVWTWSPIWTVPSNTLSSLPKSSRFSQRLNWSPFNRALMFSHGNEKQIFEKYGTLEKSPVQFYTVPNEKTLSRSQIDLLLKNHCTITHIYYIPLCAYASFSFLIKFRFNFFSADLRLLLTTFAGLYLNTVLTAFISSQ